MFSIWTLLSLMHLIGLALGMGAATVKVMILVRCQSDHEMIPVFLKVVRIITRVIITGLILLTVSGIGWVVMGTTFNTVLIVKLVFVLLIWVIGPYIDNSVEPAYIKLAPAAGAQPGPEFLKIQKKYITVDSIAAALFYVITILGVMI